MLIRVWAYMMMKSWAKHVARENAFIACANDEDSDQPVRAQSIYLVKCNVLFLETVKRITCGNSFLFDQCCTGKVICYPRASVVGCTTCPGVVYYYIKFVSFLTAE